MKINIKKELSNSKNEKDVENTYRRILTQVFKGCEITSPYSSDGILEYTYGDKTLKILLEFKFDYNLNDRTDLSKVLIQTLYYLKRAQKDGHVIDFIINGDKNEYFFLPVNKISQYLDKEGINWDIAASTAHQFNPDLFASIKNNLEINPYIVEIDDNTDISHLLDIVIGQHTGRTDKIPINAHSITNIFNQFVKKVLPTKHRLNPNEVVGLFLTCLVNPDDNYVHPKKKDILVTSSFGDVPIFKNNFIAFFNNYKSEYSPEEKQELTGICDRLIEDYTRRFKGEFFTPTEWVDEAHKMISESFGEDWKEKYVVWDPAAGTLNLTRDYMFKELYCSTLNQTDLDIATQSGYNMNATKFQYDFLNDGIDGEEISVENDDKLPDGLKRAILENKPIIVFMNPPYGSVQSFDNIKQDGGKSRHGIEETLIKKMMNVDKFGYASKNLYTQFLYKLIKIKEKFNLKNINICLFSPPLFLTGGDFKVFRNKYLKHFNYNNGMLFNAQHFANVSSWGLSFTIFDNDDTKLKNNFPISIKDYNEIFEIVTSEIKYLYNLDTNPGSNIWVREEIKDIKTSIDAPKLSSALSVKQKGYSNLIPNAIGYYYNNGNNIYYNGTNVSMFTSNFSGKCGLSVIPENFKKISSLFTARKTIQSNWINQKDEYMAPDTQHPDYEQWNNDTIVYSLFNTSSNQSSLRQVEYKDKLWDIKNEFFWMPKEYVLRLANQHHNDDVYQDCKNNFEDRYVYNLLQTVTLSPDAQKVLDKAIDIFIKTFPYRSMMAEKFHLNAWDSGWAQIKCIMKENKEVFKDDMLEFSQLYKKFEDRMRGGVYKFNFLK